MKSLTKQDHWLIERWAKARQLEDSMGAARQHYGDLFTEVHKQVKKSHPGLDRLDLHMEQRVIEQWGSNVIFSKSSWPRTSTTWRTGICMWGISLDELTAATPPEPSVHIWLDVLDRADKRIDNLRRRLTAKAPRIFKNRRLQWSQEDEDDNRVCLWYPLPEGPTELLAMLSKNEQSFVNCIARHVQLLAAFMPVMDVVLLKRKST